MIELYIIGYILIALALAIHLRGTTFAGYSDDLGLAVLFGIFWFVVIPLWLFSKIVDKSADIIRGDS